MKLKKFLVSFLTAACLCISLSIPAFAADMETIEEEIVVSEYEIAEYPTSRLKISGNIAYCTSESNSDGAVKITVKQVLEKYSGWLWIWDEVDGAKWSSSVNQSSISVYNSKSGLSSGTYRLKSVFTLTSSSGKTETFTIYSDERTI